MKPSDEDMSRSLRSGWNDDMYIPVVNKSFIWRTTDPKYETVSTVIEHQYEPSGVNFPWPTCRIATKEQLKVLLEYYGTAKPLRLAKNNKIKAIEFHLSFPEDEWYQIAELLQE